MPVAPRRTTQPRGGARPPLAEASRLEIADDLPSRGDRHHFFPSAAFNDSFSSANCATSFFSLPFSSSRRRLSCASETVIPPNRARQRVIVCKLTPTRRATSVTFAPPSISRIASMICPSEKLLFRPIPCLRIPARNRWPSFRGAGHCHRHRDGVLVHIETYESRTLLHRPTPFACSSASVLQSLRNLRRCNRSRSFHSDYSHAFSFVAREKNECTSQSISGRYPYL